MARVLVIEDDRDLCEVYRLAFKCGGHEAAGFFEAPEPVLRRGARIGPVDVIILDERFPGASGLEWLPRLRGAFPGARILVASVDAGALEKATDLGADAALLKPFPIGEFLEQIHVLARTPPTSG